MKKQAPCNYRGLFKFGGSAEIRTLGGLTSPTVFKTAALNHSATLPKARILAVRAVSSKSARQFTDYGKVGDGYARGAFTRAGESNPICAPLRGQFALSGFGIDPFGNEQKTIAPVSF